MSISIRELKKDVLGQDISISVILRRAILVAKAKGDKENEAWMTAELNGYEDTGEPPKFRILYGQPMLYNPYAGWEILHYRIADEQIVELLTSMPITCPIAQVEQYAQSAEGTMLHYGERFEQYINSTLNKIGKPALSLTNTQFQKIVEVVRNKLFEWVSQFPDEVETRKDRDVMPHEKTWKDSVENHPIRYALLIVIGTAIIVAGIMGWIQKNREDNLTIRCETEKTGMKNDYEAQIRELRSKLAEAEDNKPRPASIPK